MATQSGKILIHPLLVRITHWINVAAMLIMIFSGWRIYNASPLFSFKFPVDLTLGGWLGGAPLQSADAAGDDVGPDCGQASDVSGALDAVAFLGAGGTVPAVVSDFGD